MSLRLKTVIGIVLLQAGVLSILVGVALFYLDNWSQDALRQRASETSQVFATLVQDAVISTDLATLEEMAIKVTSLPEIAYIRVSDREGVLARQADTLIDDSSDMAGFLMPQGDQVIDVRSDVSINGIRVGEVRLGYYEAGIIERLQTVAIRLALIALLGLLALGAASWWMGWRLTRLLALLKHHAESLANGEQPTAIKVRGDDELAVTARAFNRMLETLQGKREKLSAKVLEVQNLGDRIARSELYLRTVLESVSDGIVAIDEDGVISRINPAAASLFGYSEDELQGCSARLLIPELFVDGSPEDTPHLAGISRQATCIRRDGSEFPVDLRVSKMQIEGRRFFVGLVRDLSLNRVLEAEVRRTEEIKAMIVDASLDGLITIDMQGRVVEYNAAAEQMFGWRRDEILGQDMAEYIIPPDLRQGHHHGMEQFRRDGTGPLIGGRAEVEAMCRDGQRIPVELSLVACSAEGERLATAFLRDIRARKATEQALIDARDAAEASSRAKSRFLSHMSHEIRSPLNAVLASVNLVAESVDDAELQRLLKTAQSSGALLLSVINEVLDFSRIEAGYLSITRVETRLEPLVKEVLGAAQARDENASLDLVCQVTPAASGPLLVDPARVYQIINILVDNAMKFTASGIVAVVAERVQGEEGPQLRLSVRDTGVGIAPEQQAAIFEEFEQVDATRDTGYGGTGLGLTIARRLVELMGGQLGVDSTLGPGSCFHFTIPVEFLGPPVSPPAVIGAPPLVCLVSPNAGLGEMFVRDLGEIADEVKVFGEAQAFCSWAATAGSVPSGALLVDEAVLYAVESSEMTERLAHWQGPVGILSRRQTPPEARFGAAVLLEKPLCWSDLLRFLAAEHTTAETTDQPQEAPAAKAQHTGRVLLVEDVAANRLVASKLLARHGYVVTEAADGLEGLQRAAEAVFDVILMDVRMPRLNGIDCVLRLRLEPGPNRETPVIALTANAERSEIKRCLEAGMNEFVSKPFDALRLLELVRAYADRQTPCGEEPPVAADQQDPLLNILVLQQLARDTSPEMMPEMLQLFEEELKQRRQECSQGLADRDRLALAESAHALKSCAGTFGAVRLQQAARTLEQRARSETALADVTAMTQALINTLDATLAAYRQLDFSMING